MGEDDSLSSTVIERLVDDGESKGDDAIDGDGNVEQQQDNDDEGLCWFANLLGSHHDDDSSSAVEECDSNGTEILDLDEAIHRLKQQVDTESLCRDCRERTQAIAVHMGSMALCRGERGDLLREAGAMDALLSMLSQLKDFIPPINSDQEEYSESSETTTATLELATACLGALRDLACGNALNRSAVKQYQTEKGSGLWLLAFYVERYHDISWQAIGQCRHLKLLTGLMGALRNVTHSAACNCAELHHLGVSSMLIWRLVHGDESRSPAVSLPDSEEPWREAAFRAAGTLINLSEKCPECAALCGSDPLLIPLLIEAWGGKNGKQPLLHLGLAAILHAAQQAELPEYDTSWNDILRKEKQRKRAAQAREEQRKEKLLSIT